jgi:hypothetical protein
MEREFHSAEHSRNATDFQLPDVAQKTTASYRYGEREYPKEITFDLFSNEQFVCDIANMDTFPTADISNESDAEAELGDPMEAQMLRGRAKGKYRLQSNAKSIISGSDLPNCAVDLPETHHPSAHAKPINIALFKNLHPQSDQTFCEIYTEFMGCFLDTLMKRRLLHIIS